MNQIAQDLGADATERDVRRSLIRWLARCGAAFCWSKHLDVISREPKDPWTYWCRCCSNEAKRRAR